MKSRYWRMGFGADGMMGIVTYLGEGAGFWGGGWAFVARWLLLFFLRTNWVCLGAEAVLQPPGTVVRRKKDRSYPKSTSKQNVKPAMSDPPHANAHFCAAFRTTATCSAVTAPP